MESQDRERIMKMLFRDIRLKRLYDEHCRFENELSRFKDRPFLTLDEEKEEKLLKKKKLAGVDEMMQILSVNREAA